MASQPWATVHNRRKILQFGLSAAFVPMAPAIARAQASDLPAGPIRVILPTLHGGQADTLGHWGTCTERVAMPMTGKARSVLERYIIVSAGHVNEAARRLDAATGTISGTIDQNPPTSSES